MKEWIYNKGELNIKWQKIYIYIKNSVYTYLCRNNSEIFISGLTADAIISLVIWPSEIVWVYYSEYNSLLNKIGAVFRKYTMRNSTYSFLSIFQIASW